MRDLHQAARSGNLELVKELIQEEGALDRRDEYEATPLDASLSSDCPECVRALLDAGANPRATSTDGYTPLHRAAIWPWTENMPSIVNMLIGAGADMEARLLTRSSERQTGCWTPLMLAAHEGPAEAVTCLLECGACVDAVDECGRTALMLAANQPTDTENKIRMLLKAGADANRTSQEGKRAYEYANEFANNLKQGHEEYGQQVQKELTENTVKMLAELGIDPEQVQLPDVRTQALDFLGRWSVILQLLSSTARVP
jgi:ankyrin repeat protein